MDSCRLSNPDQTLQTRRCEVNIDFGFGFIAVYVTNVDHNLLASAGCGTFGNCATLLGGDEGGGGMHHRRRAAGRIGGGGGGGSGGRLVFGAADPLRRHHHRRGAQARRPVRTASSRDNAAPLGLACKSPVPRCAAQFFPDAAIRRRASQATRAPRRCSSSALSLTQTGVAADRRQGWRPRLWHPSRRSETVSPLLGLSATRHRLLRRCRPWRRG